MSTPTVEPTRTKKRPSPNDENIKPNLYATNLSPSKLLASPLHSFKKIFWREEEEDETTLAVKKPKHELLSPGASNSGFITSSPNPKRPLAKAPQIPSVPVTKEAPSTPSSRRLSRNLADEFEEASPTKSDTSLDLEIKKKTLLNTLFSPVFTLFNGKQSGSKSEKNSPSKNELSSDETLEPASALVFQRDIPEKINYDLYQQYGEYIVSVQEELCKEQEVTEEDIECEEEEEYEEEDDLDFDPFQFIAQLPDVSELEKRPILLPAKTKNTPKMTLVLDLDETLVHCSTEQLAGAELTFPVMYGGREYQVFVRRRPYIEEFLKRVSQLFEVVVFTASQEVYASKLLDLIDTENKYVHHRLYRDSCVCVEGNYLKDLSVLGRDLASVVIVDNSPQAFGFQLENGIPIESWFEDVKDTELLKLIPFLESLLKVKDVRPLVREKYKLYEKVDAYKPNDCHP